MSVPVEFCEESIIKREEWGAAESTGPMEDLTLPVDNVIMSYTGTNPCNTTEECKQMMRELQAEYQKNKFPDVGQNFYVGGDGSVFEGRGWKSKPLKHPSAPDLYGKSIEICHFGPKGDYPPLNNVFGLWDLIQLGIRNKYIKYRPTYYAYYFEHDVFRTKEPTYTYRKETSPADDSTSLGVD